MNGDAPSALRREYWSLVLETINRYVAAGHELSLETVNLEDSVRVSLCFEPEAFAAHFEHMGAEVGAADFPAKPD